MKKARQKYGPLQRSVAVAATTAAMMVLFAAAILLLGACDLSGGADSAYGSLRLRILQPLGQQGFQPDDTVITHYRVRGFGPSERKVDVTVEAGPSQIDLVNLLPGAWTFVVDALNSSGVPILTGQRSAFIEAGQSTEIDITLAPDSGDGTLVVEFTWPVATLEDGQAGAGLAPYLADDFGTAVPLSPFVASQANGIEVRRYEGTHSAGYYRLDPTISDNGVDVFSDTTTVRILAGLTTVVAIDLETGDVDLVIELQPQQPLSVNLTPDTLDPLVEGESLTVTATVGGGSGSYTLRWYLNGQLLSGQTGLVIELGSDLDPGRYRLTLIAADGVVLGSAGIEFDVVPQP